MKVLVREHIVTVCLVTQWPQCFMLMLYADPNRCRPYSKGVCHVTFLNQCLHHAFCLWYTCRCLDTFGVTSKVYFTVRVEKVVTCIWPSSWVIPGSGLARLMVRITCWRILPIVHVYQSTQRKPTQTHVNSIKTGHNYIFYMILQCNLLITDIKIRSQLLPPEL